MTYAQIRRFTLELINRQSVAGEAVSPAYNQQSDIISRIPNLINSALSQIALSLDPFGGVAPDTLTAPEAWTRAACYYAAAYLVADENEFLYAALMNEFETLLTRISARRIRAEYTETQADYGFGGAEWLL